MLHLPELIKDLALILGSAAIITLLFKMLKQPVVLGYIIAGFIVGPHFKIFPTIVDVESIKTWADIGVIFLLFGLGLEFSFKKLIKVGGVSVVTALTEVSLTLFLGFGVGRLLGWNTMDCLFLGGILAIASTTIIIRAFDELKVKSQKFSGIVTGVLVIEDLVAVLLLVLLSTVAVSKTFAGAEMILSVVKLAFFLILWFVSGIFFLPSLLRKLQHLLTEETLLIISLALCLMMVVLSTLAGFSPALGAFIMGSILAETTKAEKIEHLIKSVKDFFGTIFFVSVGMLLDPVMLKLHFFPIIAATLVLLIGKPIFVTLGALASGQPLKIAVQSGMSLSQIGELSFIIATLGLTLNVTSQFLYPIAVAVSVVTTFTTPYMIRSSDWVSRTIESLLPGRWKQFLENYSIGAQNITEISDWKKIVRFYFKNIILFSVIVITIILLSIRYLSPLFKSIGWSDAFTAFVTLLLLAPFLWALAFRRTNHEAYAKVWLKSSSRGPLIALLLSRILLAVFYLGFLFDSLFSPLTAIIGVIVTCFILILFYKKIKAFYGKIEQRFLHNFNQRELDLVEPKRMLTPWDTHITIFEVHMPSPIVGKPLSEIRLRETFGINIVLIERDDFVIHVPNRHEHLYPGDKISVIGTDDQLTAFKAYLESTEHHLNLTENRQKITLQHFSVGPNSPLINQSIQGSGIRERSKGLIVGIERNGKRILNPESYLVFEKDDLVWIVGNELRIQILIREWS